MSGEIDLWASLPVPALQIGTENEIVDINSAAEGFFNTSAKSLRGRPVWDKVAIDAPLEEAFERARENGTPLFVNDVDIGSGERAPLQCGLQIAPLSGHPGQMITIHGRTRCQFYKGRADWAAIRAVKAAVRVPVLANGDIVDGPSARRALEQSGADGVMIGRGAQGRPWLLAQVAAEMCGTPAPEIPQGAALADLVAAHYEAMLGFYGRDLGGRAARKHLGWYMDHAGTGAYLRRRVLTAGPDTVLHLLPDAMQDSVCERHAA
jgi:hypothetical protein